MTKSVRLSIVIDVARFVRATVGRKVLPRSYYAFMSSYQFSNHFVSLRLNNTTSFRILQLSRRLRGHVFVGTSSLMSDPFSTIFHHEWSVWVQRTERTDQLSSCIQHRNWAESGTSIAYLSTGRLTHSTAFRPVANIFRAFSDNESAEGSTRSAKKSANEHFSFIL
jgi:hypothetical protein